MGRDYPDYLTMQDYISFLRRDLSKAEDAIDAALVAYEETGSPHEMAQILREAA